MKLFIRGKLPKQTQQPGADISVAVGNESEGRDGDRVGWTCVTSLDLRVPLSVWMVEGGGWRVWGGGRGLFCLRTRPSMSVLWPEPPSDHFL